MRGCCAKLGNTVDTHAKQKLLTKLKLAKVPEAEEETDHSLEFGKACEDHSCDHCTSTPNTVVKNLGTKQRVQKILGDCWQWEANGQCVK